MQRLRHERERKRSRWFSVVGLIVFIAAGLARGGDLSILHSFDGSGANDGASPTTALVAGSGGIFYGTTSGGGANGSGTIFEMTSLGAITVLHSFGDPAVAHDGVNPIGKLILTNGFLYGTTQGGGSANEGVIFKISTSGVYTLLHTFGGGSVAHDGANPQAGLILATDGNFYGTTQNGGSASQGAAFQMTLAGAVKILHSFGDGSVVNDGAQPVAELAQAPAVVLASGAATSDKVTFFGTTLRGGAQDAGTIFALSSTGVVQIFHSFGDVSITGDGQLPHAAPTVHLLSVYGTTTTGGTLGRGTVYAMDFAGHISILHSFGDGSVANDGENPISGVVIPAAQATDLTPTLYGTTQNGGTGGVGVVYSCALADSGATTTIVHNFGDETVTNDGTVATAGVAIGSDGNLYGTTVGGGSGSGTAYAMAVAASSSSSSAGWSYTGNLPPGLTLDPVSGTISGTPLTSDTPGIYSITLNFSGLGTSFSQTIAVKVTQIFAIWAAQHAISQVPDGITGADKIPSLLKYFFDIDPSQLPTSADLAAMPSLGTFTPDGTSDVYLTLTFREFVGTIDVVPTLQSSTDLQTWTDVPLARLLSQQTGTDAITGDPIMQMGMKITGNGKQFLRINLTQP